MARVFLPLLLTLIHRGKDRGGAPVAQAFEQHACRKWSHKADAFSRIHRQGAPPRSPLRRRAPAVPATHVVAATLLEMKNNVSEKGSLGAPKPSLPTSPLLLIALASLSLTTLAAFTDLLPGPPVDATAPPPFFATVPFGVLFAGACDPYSTSGLVYRDLGAAVVCLVGAAAFVKGITYPSKLGYIESRDSRKIIHTLSAPLFLLLWPLFSDAYGARVFASIIPFMNTFRIFAAGSAGSETELAGALSRSGDAKEALGGPLIYVLVLLVSTLLFWRDSPVGIVAISTMAVGDGLADLIGRRYGSSNKWFFNKQKSIAGSAAFVAGSFLGSFGLMVHLGLDPPSVGRLFAIAVICAGVELIPVGDDNWTVPLSAAILSAIFLA